MLMPDDPLRHAPVVAFEHRRRGRRTRPEAAGAPTRAEVAAAMAAAEGMMAISSLERAVSGEGTLGDVGGLSWMVLRTVVPCTSLAIFVNDPSTESMVARFAAGRHSVFFHEARVVSQSGPIGSAAARRRPVLNGDPARDLGGVVTTLDPALLSCATVPLVFDGCLLGVLALYASTREGFTVHHKRLLDLLAPSLAVSVATVVEAPLASAAQPVRTKASHLRLVHRS
jgi:GAF domain-containing protein